MKRSNFSPRWRLLPLPLWSSYGHDRVAVAGTIYIFTARHVCTHGTHVVALTLLLGLFGF